MSPPGTDLRRGSPLLYLADGDGPFRARLAAELRAAGAVVLEFANSAHLGAYAAAAEPDLILLAGDSGDAASGPVYGRLKSSRTGRRFPLVLVLDRSRPPDAVARSVLALCEDWNRLCVQNLAGVVTWLQTRGKSGRFEVEAFGTRGTIFLQDGELVEARWKELEGREVVRFFAEELPDSGFRFAEAAGPPDDRALEVPRAPAALEVPHAPVALEPGAPPHPAAPPFGEIYTAVVRIDLGSDGRLRRAVVRAGNGVTHAGNGVAGAAHGSPGVANGRPEGENDSPGPARGAVAAVNSVAGPLNDVAGPANRVAAPIPHDAPGPRLVPSGAAPRRPTALVRAISRAEREALLTGTYPPR